MKLFRPYIPVKVRLAVAERQFATLFGAPANPHPGVAGGKRLAALLGALFGATPYQLHHRPALCNRRRSARRGKVVYDPPANDPDHLVYLAKDVHGIETRVRGVGAARSDLGQLRYNKRVARNRGLKVGDLVTLKTRRGKTIKTYRIAAVVPAKGTRKYNWPKRPLRSRGFR